MPKKVEIPGFVRRIHFPGEFKENFEKFEKTIKLDPNIQNILTPVQKTSGILSAGIREAIRFYLYGDSERKIPGKYVLYLKKLREQKMKKIEKSKEVSQSG